MPTADLQITKTDGKTTAVPGTNDTYTITVTNNGPSTVTAPASPTCPAGSPASSGRPRPRQVERGRSQRHRRHVTTVTLRPAAPSASPLTARSSPTATGSLSNTATVSAPAGVTDPNPGNNSATDTDTLTPEADLSITKTDGTTSVVPGTNDTYTITVTNNGPSTVSSLTLTDAIPTRC